MCLDYHLNEHIFQRGNSQAQQQHLESLGLRGDKLSVKENFLLRESIKVKTSTNETTESQLQRAEALRNEAGVALRGLFVFGHRNQDVESINGDTVLPQTMQPSNVALPGGFNLNHNPNNNSDDLGMSSSNYQTEGLRIIDDDEAAVEEADISNWIEVQEAFPYLNINAKEYIPQQPPPTNNSDVDNNGNDCEDVSDLLQTTRHVANLTKQEEEERAKRLERAQQQYFLDALQRKRVRIEARRRAKEDALMQMQDEKKAEETLISARAEIDEWRSQQWARWDRIASIKSSKAKKDKDIQDSKLPSETGINENDKVDNMKVTNELAVGEKEAKAAMKKKLKRQKAKERAKEKKRLERIEAEKKERELKLQKKKEESKKRCGACGGGILGSGFEKVRQRLCCVMICYNLFLLSDTLYHQTIRW